MFCLSLWTPLWFNTCVSKVHLHSLSRQHSQDERNCCILRYLSAVPDIGDCLCGISSSLELHLPRWICMGRLSQALQLAPGLHGHWNGGSLWEWYVWLGIVLPFVSCYCSCNITHDIAQAIVSAVCGRKFVFVLVCCVTLFMKWYDWKIFYLFFLCKTFCLVFINVVFSCNQRP